MFGVVPRVLWEHEAPPDEQNRIQLETNCMLVRTPDSLGLIDTGYGSKAPAKFRRHHALDEGSSLVRNLNSAGIAPNDIDWVILTHLHFDHAGGATYRDEAGIARPTFPRARHLIQRAEWEDATGNIPELTGAYYMEDFVPLHEARLLELIDGDIEVAAGVRTQLTGGHTRGHQIVRIDSAGESAVCLADICPTIAHLPTFWTLAYDQFPLDVRHIKPIILNEIVAQGRTALFSHDPHVAAARLSRNSANEWSTATLATADLPRQ
ncbi:MAG TPA: MBL fold metallo-hydrolase [Lacipirellulaceae bacterium]|nr:MBL fold metallo-hydrolase [Lacipirellulaceae bacterium]